MPEELASQEVAASATEPETRSPEPTDDPAFERLLQFLKESRSFDFTGYKRPSLIRRVRHRMHEIDVASFEDYQDVLQLDPAEFTALFNTILINVTSFFRDVDAWNQLRAEILPRLLARSDGAAIRVWSAGCATGQEAYTIAVVLHEALGPRFRDQVKIYATDVDKDALNYARQAIYTARELEGLPVAYRERYFDAFGDRFSVIPDLRRNVIFGRNDLTRDAPISRIDILICRNTLMYFNAETQTRIVSRLAFALRPGGVLFLGKAEMLLNHTAVFDPIDLKRRFFRRSRAELGEGGGLAGVIRVPNRATAIADDEAAALRNETLITSPVAQLAVGRDGRVAMVNQRATALLGVTEGDVGRPFQDLDVSYRPLELRSHLAAASANLTPVWLREVEWRRSDAEPVYVDIQIVPLLDPSGGVHGASITFTDVTRFRQLRVEVEAANRQLELAYEELQSTNEELETTNEELQSTVEELETTNEELQSTNEELETMNEELQSANDELQSTNDQLRDRTAEVGNLNRFMQSILSSFDSAVIVVDRDLVVQVWTPQAYELWGLRTDETVGHYLLNLDSGLPTGQLHPWLRAVVTGSKHAVIRERLTATNRRGRPVELQVSITGLRPAAATEDGPVNGALLLLEDVTDMPV